MAALFTLGAAVQFNDPDPVRWITVYAAAAGVSAAGAWRGRVPLAWPVAVGVTALVWGVWLATGVEGLDVYGSMFDAWEMTSGRVEVAREASGLILMAAWMAVVAGRAYGRATHARRHTDAPGR